VLVDLDGVRGRHHQGVLCHVVVPEFAGNVSDRKRAGVCGKLRIELRSYYCNHSTGPGQRPQLAGRHPASTYHQAGSVVQAEKEG
jgi:hypothetical protein